MHNEARGGAKENPSVEGTARGTESNVRFESSVPSGSSLSESRGESKGAEKKARASESEAGGNLADNE